MNIVQRFTLAIAAFFSVLGNAQTAQRVQKALPPSNEPKPTDDQGGELPQTTISEANVHPDALHLLAILQREGRFVDFIQEDLAGFSDEQVGMSARAVHEGCRKAIRSCIQLAPIVDKPEGSTVSVSAEEAGTRVTLTGNLSGKAPFQGILCHPGWQAVSVQLPQVSGTKDMRVIAPAEVDL